MADAAPAKPLGLLDLSLYMVVAMIGIRWLPVAAALGPSALPIWVFGLLVFFLPLSVATVELTGRFPGEGSLYSWVRGTLGPSSGFLCGWFYWVSLLPYFAGIIYFLSGVILTAAGADTHNTVLYLFVSIVIVAFATAIQLAGLRIGKWLTNIGASGSWLVFALFIGVAGILVWRGQSATDFVHASYIPPANFDTAILWGTVVFAICGSEAVAFLRDGVKGGMRTIRKVLVTLGIAMVTIYGVGTAAMLIILPNDQLTRLSGLPDAINAAFAHVGYPGLAVFALALFTVSQMGGLSAWFGIGTRLPMEAGIDSFLPPVFARRNPKTGAPVAAILLQAGVTLFIVVLSQAGEGAAAAYDFLVSMSVLTVAIPYVYVFVAYLARARWPDIADAWLPPGGARTGRILGTVGLVFTLIAIACTLIPSNNDAHPMASFLKIVVSTAVMVLVGLALYWLGTRKRAVPAVS